MQVVLLVELQEGLVEVLENDYKRLSITQVKQSGGLVGDKSFRYKGVPIAGHTFF